MIANPDQLPTYKALFPVQTTRTTSYKATSSSPDLDY
jgi:hypothetical protein